MPLYHYKARGPRGDAVEGRLEAATAEAVASELMEGGLTPVAIEETRDQGGVTPWWRRLAGGPRPGELARFARQMHSLLHAGVPLIQALQGLTRAYAGSPLAEVLQRIIRSLEAGHDLASALHRQPETFSPLFVALVRMGEQSGRLEAIFAALARDLEREEQTRKRLRAASRYPLLVIAVTLIAVAVIDLQVVPAFAQVFRQFGTELPLPTRVLLASSRLLIQGWPVLLLGLLLGGLGLRLYLQDERGRYRWDRWRLHLPLLGPLLQQAALARFGHGFALAQASGLPLITGLTLVARALGNRFIESRILAMRDGIERGERLSETARRSGVFDDLALQMFAVGETTGTLDDLMEEIAGYYDRELDYALDRLSAAVEPLLTLIVALLVGLVAVAVFLPWWDLARVVLHGGH